MRGGSAPGGSSGSGGARQQGGSAERSDAWPSWLDWASGLRRPVAVRVPMGLLIAVGVLLVLLLVAAYWVGAELGDAAARSELADQQRVLPANGGRGQTTGLISAGGSDGVSGGGDASGNSGSQADRLADPRVIGMNYLILARYPREEALRLVSFLRQHGVASMVLPTDNAGLYLVTDRQGFTPEQVRSEVYEQRKAELKRLGRLWKSAHDGPTDLSDLYGQKYRG